MAVTAKFIVLGAVMLVCCVFVTIVLAIVAVGERLMHKYA
jgi:hypothetical protein